MPIAFDKDVGAYVVRCLNQTSAPSPVPHRMTRELPENARVAYRCTGCNYVEWYHEPGAILDGVHLLPSSGAFPS